jgi:hypothetical protein
MYTYMLRRALPYWMWHRILWQKCTDFSKEGFASISTVLRLNRAINKQIHLCGPSTLVEWKSHDWETGELSRSSVVLPSRSSSPSSPDKKVDTVSQEDELKCLDSLSEEDSGSRRALRLFPVLSSPLLCFLVLHNESVLPEDATEVPEESSSQLLSWWQISITDIMKASLRGCLLRGISDNVKAMYLSKYNNWFKSSIHSVPHKVTWRSSTFCFPLSVFWVKKMCTRHYETVLQPLLCNGFANKRIFCAVR